MDEQDIRWAPRVSQRKVRRLYETDARGIYDEDLLDDVGWTLYLLCDSFLAAEAARAGRVCCHGCGETILCEGERTADALLHCSACGWQVTWGVYFRSIQHKQLSGPDLIPLFQDYLARFPAARTPQDKMLLIDRLLHGFHWSVKSGPRRPSGINLIEGRLYEVVEFLDALTYGPASTPGTQDTLRSWRKDMDRALRSWGHKGLDSAKE